MPDTRHLYTINIAALTADSSDARIDATRALSPINPEAKYGIAYCRHSSNMNEPKIRVKPRRSAPMPKNRVSKNKVK